MRSLALVRFPPYPPMGGSALRNWQNICLLRQYGTVGVFSIYWGAKEQETLPGIEFWQHCNVCGAKQTLLTKVQRRLQNVRPQGHPNVDWPYSAEFAQKLSHSLEQFQPDLVFFGEIWLYRYFSTVKQYGVAVILDSHNVEGDREAVMLASFPKWTEKLQALIRLQQIRSIEAAFIRQATQTWLCSPEDQALLHKYYGNRASTWVIPNGVDVEFYQPIRQGQLLPPEELQHQSHTVLFLGLFGYGPNAEAAKILLEEIYPLLRARYPDCRILLVGSEPTPWMQQAAQEDSCIFVTGKVPDVRPYLAAASVMVVPLRQGGGTRLKILEAFAAGCPVVSTAKGAEGIDVVDGQNVLLRESAAGLAAGIIGLWEDSDLSNHLAVSAWELVNARYSRIGVSQQMSHAIAALPLKSCR